MGSSEDGSVTILDTGLRDSAGDVPAGTAVMATSVNRLTASNRTSINTVRRAHPEHHHEARDLGKDPEPGGDVKKGVDSEPAIKGPIDTDVGDILISEGLARRFVCGATSCPRRRPWC